MPFVIGAILGFVGGYFAKDIRAFVEKQSKEKPADKKPGA